MFIAAACNSQQAANTPSSQTPTTAGAKVDAAVNNLNTSVDSEDAVNMQSDDDVVNSDQSVINSYNGVSNASSY
jgi:hypothetical protein